MLCEEEMQETLFWRVADDYDFLKEDPICTCSAQRSQTDKVPCFALIVSHVEEQRGPTRNNLQHYLGFVSWNHGSEETGYLSRTVC